MGYENLKPDANFVHHLHAGSAISRLWSDYPSASGYNHNHAKFYFGYPYQPRTTTRAIININPISDSLIIRARWTANGLYQ